MEHSDLYGNEPRTGPTVVTVAIGKYHLPDPYPKPPEDMKILNIVTATSDGEETSPLGYIPAPITSPHHHIFILTKAKCMLRFFINRK